MKCLTDLYGVGLGGGSRIENRHDTGIAFTADQSAYALTELDEHIGGTVSIYKGTHIVAVLLLFFHKCASHREGQSYDDHGRKAVADTVNTFPHRTGGEEDAVLGLLKVGDGVLIASGHANGIVCGELVLEQIMNKAQSLVGGEQDRRVAVGRSYDLIDLICYGFEVILALVVGNGHTLGNIQPCMVGIVEGRFRSRFEEQSVRDLIEAVFRFEVFKVRAIGDGAGGQHMADIAIPHLTAEDVIDVLRRTAHREDTVLICIQPHGAFTALIEGGDRRLEVVSSYGDTVIAFNLHCFDLLDEVHHLLESCRLEGGQGDNASSFFVNVIAMAKSTEAIKECGVFLDETIEEFLILFSVIPRGAENLHAIHIAEDVLLADSLAEGIFGCFLELMGFVHHHKTTLTEQRRMVIRLCLLRHEVHIVVGYLKVQVGQVVHSVGKLVICTDLLSATPCTGAFDADSALDRTADAVFVEVDATTKFAELLEQFNGFSVFLGVLPDVLEEVLIPILTEVMFLAFAEYRRQRLLDDIIVEEHLGQVGDFSLYECLLQLDTGGGDGDRQILTVCQAIMMFGDNGCHQIRKGLSSSDLCFTEGNLLFSKADIHLLCETDLFLSDVVSVIGKHHTKDRVNDLEGVIRKTIEVSRIAGVLHRIENVRDQFSEGCFGVEIAGVLCDHARGKTGGHVDCYVIHLVAKCYMVDEVSSFKGKIIGAAFMGFPCILVIFKGFVVAVSKFKHIFSPCFC